MEFNEVKVTDFFENDYAQYAAYEVARKIASYIDGFNISRRKVIHTAIEKKIINLKVERLMAKTSEFCDYHHGSTSLYGPIIGVAQDFVGPNNVPLLTTEGNFGVRTVNKASAERYISTSCRKNLQYIFKKDDKPLLVKQTSEDGEMIIEPRFFVPTIPMILANGFEGLSIGFRQFILPRDPEKLINYIENRLTGKTPRYDFLPYYKGFTGKVTDLGDNSYKIDGKFMRKNTTTILITELPFGYNKSKRVTYSLIKKKSNKESKTLTYIEYLDHLQDEGIIKNYKDLSIENTFKFEVKVTRDFLNKHTDEKILDIFALSNTYKEYYNCNDEKMSIIHFDSSKELIERYIKIKLYYTKKRKAFLLKNIIKDIKVLKSKIIFIKLVVSKKLQIMNSKTKDIITDLEKVKKIEAIDGSYDFLLNMPISSITEEKQSKMMKDIMNHKNELDVLKNTSIQKMWLNDLKELRKNLYE